MHVSVCQKIQMSKEENEEAYFSERKKTNQKKIFTHGYLHLIVILNSHVIGVQNP